MTNEIKSKTKVTFYSGVGTVTGANFLLEKKSERVLVDCGLIQGPRHQREKNKEKFGYNPAEISTLFVTHGHADHIGRIGKLVKEGFNGVIYSTPATKEIAELMMEDAVGIMESEEKKTGEKPLYGMSEVNKALSLWQTLDYGEEKDLENFKVKVLNAGHILGSAMYEFTDKEIGIKTVFTGDLGNSPNPLLPDTEKVSDADYLIMESVYGDRDHEDVTERKERLKRSLRKVIDRGGTTIMPVFSLEKTQVLLKELNDLIEGGSLPSVPVFLDSPLAIRLTEVYGDYTKYFKKEIQDEIKAGDDIFEFPKLKMTLRRNESEAIGKTGGPKIIVAASGMSEGGRITTHEKRYLPDNKNALVLIGYQVAGSLGRRIQDGMKQITIDGTDVPINAEIIKISGYSSHKDSDNLLDFVSGSAKSLKKVFAVMGEPKSALFFVQKVRDNLEVDAVHPEEGQSFVLD